MPTAVTQKKNPHPSRKSGRQKKAPVIFGTAETPPQHKARPKAAGKHRLPPNPPPVSERLHSRKQVVQSLTVRVAPEEASLVSQQLVDTKVQVVQEEDPEDAAGRRGKTESRGLRQRRTAAQRPLF